MAKRRELMEWAKALIIAVILVFLIRYFLFAPIVVDGSSMVPTLQNEDRMIVNKLSSLIGLPDRFDIIVFEAPEGKDYIKRVIGLPGDKITYKNDVLYINGKAYDEPYLDELKKQLADGAPLTGPFKLSEITDSDTVPDGELFVLGDNRRVSKDSRHIGFVSMDKVLGTAKLVYWPLNQFKLAD